MSAEARKKFWLDRARTAAIARHTNAFKINEDVVIPLERLGDYTDGIERINIEMSIAQQARAAAMRLRRSSQGPTAGRRCGAPSDRDRRTERTETLAAKVDERARADRTPVRARWQDLLDRARRDAFAALQSHALRRVVEDRAQGAARADLRRRRVRADARALSTTIHRAVLHGRVFVALHMHAGDGNVHTNIPVNSDDYAMLQEADAAVARIMALARSWAASSPASMASASPSSNT